MTGDNMTEHVSSNSIRSTGSSRNLMKLGASAIRSAVILSILSFALMKYDCWSVSAAANQDQFVAKLSDLFARTFKIDS